MTNSPNVEEMAKRLTEAQRRGVLAMQPNEYHDAFKLFRQRSTRMALTNSGITQPHRRGPITEFWWIALTPLGLAVRQHLQERSNVSLDGGME